MRIIGLEPTRLAAPDPKSGMSTNFTIPAEICECKYNYYFQIPNNKSQITKILQIKTTFQLNKTRNLKPET